MRVLTCDISYVLYNSPKSQTYVRDAIFGVDVLGLSVAGFSGEGRVTEGGTVHDNKRCFTTRDAV